MNRHTGNVQHEGGLYGYMFYIGRQGKGMQLGSFLTFVKQKPSREDPREAGVQRLYSFMFFSLFPTK